ncbi:hypothetical protein GCM10023116_00890 [Kistimonas scapharcae]|uniref:Uncharacterized protein n=1 Tax=Kistimonas scapharcae TaxID=1036133 RepID=A0ABP8UW74_9GAMM
MQNTNAFLPLFTFMLLSISPFSQADWVFDTFSSGNMKHHIARSDTLSTHQSLELFCTTYDPQLAIAMYLPGQNQRKKITTSFSLRVDKERQWTLPASAHTMSLISRQTPSQELLSDMKTGNRVTVTYPLSKDTNTSLHFSLKGSGKALARLEKQYTTSG